MTMTAYFFGLACILFGYNLSSYANAGNKKLDIFNAGICFLIAFCLTFEL